MPRSRKRAGVPKKGAKRQELMRLRRESDNAYIARARQIKLDAEFHRVAEEEAHLRRLRALTLQAASDDPNNTEAGRATDAAEALGDEGEDSSVSSAARNDQPDPTTDAEACGGDDV